MGKEKINKEELDNVQGGFVRAKEKELDYDLEIPRQIAVAPKIGDNPEDDNNHNNKGNGIKLNF